MGASFFWRDDLLDPVTEHDQAHLVAVLDSAEGENCGDLGGELHLCLGACTEVAAGGDIHAEHQGLLALLFKDLDVGFVSSGSHIPVDMTDIISVGVGSQFRKIHTANIKICLILAFIPSYIYCI